MEELIQAIKGPELTKDNQQVWYEHQVNKNIFVGLLNFMFVVIFAKYFIQYRFGYTYDEFIATISRNLSSEIAFQIMCICAILYLIMAELMTIIEYKYEEGLLNLAMYNSVRIKYYISDLLECMFSGIAISIFPLKAIICGFICGIVMSFCSLVYGYYNKEKVMHLSPVGMGIGISGGLLGILNVIYGGLELLYNITSVLMIIGAVILLLFYGGATSDKWKQVQKLYKDYSEEEQEVILRMVVYIDSHNILFEIRGIIYHLARLFSSSDDD